MIQSIKLQTSAIQHIPLEMYNKDFTFIVNGESFRTSKFVADLISRKISKYHSVDPTINEIIINTKNRGNFEEFLKLQNFEEIHPSVEEIKFICEIIKQLETAATEIKENRSEITIDNVVNRLIKDENFQEILPKFYEEEVEFISNNFSEILENQREKLKILSINTIEKIINNSNLQLENEDELLQFINKLYNESSEYSILYEYVYFCNVKSSSIEEFINIFDINDLNISTWYSISTRLIEEINNKNKYKNKYTKRNTNKRYKKDKIEIEYKIDNSFDGIFNFLKNNSNINEEIEINASSVLQGNLKQIIQSDVQNNVFATNNLSNSCVYIKFIKRKVMPTHYTIRSNYKLNNKGNPRSWVFEGSVDLEKWEKLDSQKECMYLNGNSLIHTFHITNNNNRSYKYFRIRQTGKNWNDNNYFCFNCIELYGKISTKMSIDNSGLGFWKIKTRHSYRLKPGVVDKVKVISILNPITFTIQLLDIEMDRITNYFDENNDKLKPIVFSNENDEQLYINDCVVVKISDKYYRARIDSFVTQQQINVIKDIFLIDFCEQKRDVNDDPDYTFFYLPDELKSIESQACVVKLAFLQNNLENAPDSEINNAIKDLFSLCNEVILYAHLVYEDDGVNALLTDQESRNSGTLNYVVLQKNYAHYVEHNSPPEFDTAKQLFANYSIQRNE